VVVSAGRHKLLTPQHPLTKKKKGEVQICNISDIFRDFANSSLERVETKSGLAEQKNSDVNAPYIY
jgi:hypothetical protein